MKEAVFIKQNAEKWREYETTAATTPDQLSERFIELTDDLSFARTFYPESNITQYLNGLTAKFHRKIYVNRKEERNRIARFWGAELPLLMYEAR